MSNDCGNSFDDVIGEKRERIIRGVSYYIRHTVRGETEKPRLIRDKCAQSTTAVKRNYS